MSPDFNVTPFEGFSIESNFIRRDYRGLRETEAALLRSYLQELDLTGLERVRTSWPVGKGETPAFADPDLRQLGQDLSRWKIDAILDWSGETEIVEMKSRATHTAAGQDLFYSLALGEEDLERTQHKLTLLAFRAHPDLRRLVKRTPFILHTVPGADPSSATRRALQDQLEEPHNDPRD